MGLFRKTVTADQAVEMLVSDLWRTVLEQGSDELAQICRIQGEWLAKEMLGLAYFGVTRDLAPELSSGLENALVGELVAHLNEIEYQVRPWLAGLLAAYGADESAAGAGAVFCRRVASTETDTDVIARVEAAGQATHRAATEISRRFHKRFKLPPPSPSP